MLNIARALLLLFVFAIPWEYSLDLGEPFGNVARIAGIFVLLAAVPALLQSATLRQLGAIGVVTLAYYLWFCLSYFWTVDPAATLYRLRANFQELMVVWLVWQLASTPRHLLNLLHAFVAGSWILVLLTFVEFRSMQAVAEGQIRFAAYGQDPNDLARFLDLALPLAALLVHCERNWIMRGMAAAYLFVAPFAVVLTASRGGTAAAAVALAGSLALLALGHPRRLLAFVFALPPLAAALWLFVPGGTFRRLVTIVEQLHGGDLNQRVNIWSAGWQAFVHAPILGYGAGAFVAAAHLAPIDTAHNTALSIAVTGGLGALFLATLLVFLAARSALHLRAHLRIAFSTVLTIWLVSSLTATVEENRATWFLVAAIALAARLNAEDASGLNLCFCCVPHAKPHLAPELAPQPGGAL